MTAAETLEIVHGLVENLRQVMSGERILFCLSIRNDAATYERHERVNT